jgi:hypothetical protein
MYVLKATAAIATIEIDDEELDMLLNGAMRYADCPVHAGEEHARKAGETLATLRCLSELRMRDGQNKEIVYDAFNHGVPQRKETEAGQ